MPARAQTASADSYYAATAVAHAVRAPLAADTRADACVVGGGLAGLSAALELAEAGRSVVLLEAKQVGFGASGRNGGFVGAGYAQGLDALERRLGLDHARALFELSREGVAMVADSIERFRMPGVAMRTGVLRVLRHDGAAAFEAAARHMRDAYGHALDVWASDKVREHLKSRRYFQGLLDRSALHIHPLNFVLGLARACEAAGVRIFEGSAAMSVTRTGQGFRVRCAGGTVTAEHVILCQSGYGAPLRRDVGGAVLPVATYVVASQPAPDLLDGAIATDVAVADTRRAGDYYRRLGDGRLLWGGRITTQRGAPARLAQMLKRDIASIYPQLEPLRIETAWGGLMGYAVHKMPIVRELEPRLWVSTAFGGHGLNTTMAAGRVVAEAITARSRRIDAFAPFGTRWGGGPVGRAATQLAYWWYQVRDRIDEATHRQEAER